MGNDGASPSGPGWVFLDILFYVAVFGLWVILVISLASWLVVGPVMLAGKLRRLLWSK